MKKSRFFFYMLVSSFVLLLTLAGCVRRAVDPTPEVFIPLDPPIVEVDPLFEIPATPTLAPPSLVQQDPTPTPLVIVIDPPTPTPIVIVVTATPQFVVILPETGADLAPATTSASRIWPITLILIGLSLTVFGLLNRRR
jgi:hypothetical protein